MVRRFFIALIASSLLIACGDDTPNGEPGRDHDNAPNNADYSELAALYCKVDFQCRPEEYADLALCEASAIDELKHSALYGSACSRAMEDIMRCVAAFEDCDKHRDFIWYAEGRSCADEDERVLEHCGWHF